MGGGPARRRCLGGCPFLGVAREAQLQAAVAQLGASEADWGALPEELLVAAWNVQVFGVSKMRKGDVVAELVRVLRRYDIVVYGATGFGGRLAAE